MAFSSPPAAPVETHREERGQLPAFPEVGTGAGTRLERARAYLAQGRALIEARHREGAAGLSTARLHAELMDRTVRGLFADMGQAFKTPTGLALVALGGYGRRELSPHSDVDLLLLRGARTQETQVLPFAKAFHTLLWDLKLVVGWSVRTGQECVRAAAEDHTVRTALLDARWMAGDEPTYRALEALLGTELLSNKAEVFIADKSREMRERRAKYGESVFLLEPDVKKGEGGLRDLEGALWIARARFRTRGLTGLLQSSILPPSEVVRLRSARDFLLRIRHHLHYVRGRKEDRLTFDLQEEVAKFLGYANSQAGLPVEQFMRDYYLSAKTILHATDQLVSRCEEARTARWRGPPERRLGLFKVFRGKLTLEGEGTFEKEPANIVRFFHTADAQDLPIYSWARDKIAEALPLLESHRATESVVTAFKALLTRPGTRGTFLSQMHDVGALGALLPEFGRVTALHQHDLYHVYTVDIHSLFAMKRLYALRAGDLTPSQPALSREMAQLEDPLPLYLGMMFHDAGKGLGGDHSSRGLELMTQVGIRLQLTERQQHVAAFLVHRHLLMSHTAQRRDLSDPELILQFAQEVGDVEKLTCLYLLTYADICSVGPSMWNDWKAQLLKELYDKARACLEGQSWERTLGSAVSEALSQILPDRYFRTVHPSVIRLHARLLKKSPRMPLVALLESTGAETQRLNVVALDKPGLLAIFAGVLSAYRIDILGAQVFSTTEGQALDIFDVRGPQERPLDRKRWRAARLDLWRVLQGQTTVEEVLRRRRTSPLLARPLPEVSTKVSVDNLASVRFTVIDIRAQDRVGLLYAIASSLHAQGVEINLAKVATEAHRAIDSFYVVRRGEKIVNPSEVEQLVARCVSDIERFARQ